MHARFATRLLVAALAALAALAPRGAAAQPPTIVTDPGVTYIASALTGFATTGSEMGGMLVTAYFTDGSSAGGAWGNLGGGNWGVSTSQFSVTLGAGSDTYTAPWRVQIDPDGIGISRLLFQGAPGLTVFDIIADPSLTPGSAAGRPLEIVGGDVFSTIAKYRNRVAIHPSAPMPDLYETLDMTFGVPGGARFFEFRTDTDNIGQGGRMVATPEPATFGLLAVGAVALLAADWRRRRGAAG